MKQEILGFFGICGSVAARIFGGWNAAISTLIIFMIIDYVTGLTVAGIFKNSKKTAHGGLESHAGAKGIIKKVTYIVVIYVAHRLDVVLEIHFVKNAVVFAFLLNETISIIENVGLMGIKMPAAINKAIDILGDKANKGDK